MQQQSFPATGWRVLINSETKWGDNFVLIRKSPPAERCAVCSSLTVISLGVQQDTISTVRKKRLKSKEIHRFVSSILGRFQESWLYPSCFAKDKLPWQLEGNFVKLPHFRFQVIQCQLPWLTMEEKVFGAAVQPTNSSRVHWDKCLYDVRKVLILSPAFGL